MTSTTRASMPRRVASIGAAIIAAFAFLFVQSAVPSSVSSSVPVLGVQTAEAGTNFGRVRNYSGEPVGIHCDYQSSSQNGEPTYYLPEKYPNNAKSNSTYWCTGGDTDQFQAPHDTRCINYTGPGYADGNYILRPNKFHKVSGLALVKVYAYSSSRCGGRPTFSYSPQSP